MLVATTVAPTAARGSPARDPAADVPRTAREVVGHRDGGGGAELRRHVVAALAEVLEEDVAA